MAEATVVVAAADAVAAVVVEAVAAAGIDQAVGHSSLAPCRHKLAGLAVGMGNVVYVRAVEVVVVGVLNVVEELAEDVLTAGAGAAVVDVGHSSHSWHRIHCPHRDLSLPFHSNISVLWISSCTNHKLDESCHIWTFSSGKQSMMQVFCVFS